MMQHPWSHDCTVTPSPIVPKVTGKRQPFGRSSSAGIHPWTHDAMEKTPVPMTHFGKKPVLHSKEKTPSGGRRTRNSNSLQSSFALGGGNNADGTPAQQKMGSQVPQTKGLFGDRDSTLRQGKRIIRSASAASLKGTRLLSPKDSALEPPVAGAISKTARPCSSRGRGNAPRDSGDILTYTGPFTPMREHKSARRAKTPPQRGQTFDISTNLGAKKHIPPSGQDPIVAASPRPIFQRHDEPEVIKSAVVNRPLVKKTKKEEATPMQRKGLNPDGTPDFMFKKKAPEKKMFAHADNHIMGAEVCAFSPQVKSKERPRGLRYVDPPAPIQGDPEYVAPRGVRHLGPEHHSEKKTGLRCSASRDRGRASPISHH